MQSAVLPPPALPVRRAQALRPPCSPPRPGQAADYVAMPRAAAAVTSAPEVSGGSRRGPAAVLLFLIAGLALTVIGGGMFFGAGQDVTVCSNQVLAICSDGFVVLHTAQILGGVLAVGGIASSPPPSSWPCARTAAAPAMPGTGRAHVTDLRHANPWQTGVIMTRSVRSEGQIPVRGARRRMPAADGTRQEGAMGGNPADLVLKGGHAYLVDAARSWAGAVAVADGRIAAVGTTRRCPRSSGQQPRSSTSWAACWCPVSSTPISTPRPAGWPGSGATCPRRTASATTWPPCAATRNATPPPPGSPAAAGRWTCSPAGYPARKISTGQFPTARCSWPTVTSTRRG